MFEAQKITLAQIRGWQEQIKNGTLSDVGKVYDELGSYGYHYANWAKGVATGGTATGQGAVKFMNSVYKEKHNGENMSQDLINSIRRDMALEYLRYLEREADKNGGTVSHDTDYESMRKFHEIVFDAHDLNIDYWTLNAPMSIIANHASGEGKTGKQIADEVWEELWQTDGSTPVGGFYSSLLYAITLDQSRGYMYIDKDSGQPTSSVSIIRAAVDIGKISAGQLQDVIKNFQEANPVWLDSLATKLGYKKVNISAAEQQQAQSWMGDTSVIGSGLDWVGELITDRWPLSQQHQWYKHESSPRDRITGVYFSNSHSDQASKNALATNWQMAGGKTMTQWIMAAVLNTNAINPTNSTITAVTDDNYADKGLGFIFDPGSQNKQPIDGQPGEYEFKYQLAFITESPDMIWSMLQQWQQDGRTDLVSAYLAALDQLNPVVILNRDQLKNKGKSPQSLDEVGADWVQVRVWLIQELRLQQADKTYHGLDDSLLIDTSAYQQLSSMVQELRQKYGLGADDAVIFNDQQHKQQLSINMQNNGPIHQVTLMGDSGGNAQGGAAADVLIGGKGRDILNGGDGDDYLSGGAGNDTLAGGKGNDILAGGKGNDIYQYNSGDMADRIIDEDGNGSLKLNGKAFSSYGWQALSDQEWCSKDGQWRIKLTAEGDLLIQSAADRADQLTISGWETMGGNRLGIKLPKFKLKQPVQSKYRLYMGDSRAEIVQEAGFDTAGYFNLDKAAAGQHYGSWDRNKDGTVVNGVYEAGFEDVIRGSDQADLMHGFGGGDALDGGKGDDYIYGDDGNDLLVGGGGSDHIYGGDGDDYIFANASLRRTTDRLRPGERWQMPADGVELVYAGPTWGVYKNKNGGTIYYGMTSQMDDSDETGGDYLYGGAGNDMIIGSNQDDYIEGDGVGETGNDTLYGLGGNDTIIGGNGDDLIWGDGLIARGYMNSTAAKEHGNDHLDGGAGNDTIVGGGGDDYILGGDGDDKLYGDQEFIGRLDEAYHGVDTIYGGAGDDYIVGGGKGDFLHGGSGNDRIWGDANDREEHPELAGDDYIWGDEGNDQIYGGAGNDHIWGGADNDTIWGDSGNDSLYGDDGDDVIYGDTLSDPLSSHGADYLEGGAGDDQLVGAGGDDTIYGGDGDDVIWGDDSRDNHELNSEMKGDDRLFGGAGKDEIYGGYGDDLIDGGEGNDKLFGGAGRDTLIGGDGDDVIIGDFSSEHAQNQLASGNEFDDLIYGGNGNDQITGGIGHDTIYGGSGNDTIWGDLGVGLTQHQPQHGGNDVIYAEEGDDYVDGGYGDDLIDGGAGNDTLIGGGGGDTIYGGDGDDYITGDTAVTDLAQPSSAAVIGNNRLFGGDGNDTILGGWGNDLIQGDAGNDWLYGLAGDDRIFGGDGDDVLVGGSGNDYLNGGAGNDTYVYYSGDGVTTIEDSEGQTVIVLDTLSQFDLAQDDNGVVLVNRNNHDEIHLLGYYLDGRAGGLDLNQVYFNTDDQGALTLQAWIASMQHHHGSGKPNTIEGDENNNLLYGTEEADVINGYGGNDYLFGQGGDDVLNGGSGNDVLVGGAGNDSYVFEAGHGQDIIQENGTEQSRLVFEGAQVQNARFNQVGNDLVIAAYDSADSVTIQNFFSLENYESFRFVFEDQTVWLTAARQSLASQAETQAQTELVFRSEPSAERQHFYSGDDMEAKGVYMSDNDLVAYWHELHKNDFDKALYGSELGLLPYGASMVAEQTSQPAADAQVLQMIQAMAAFVPSSVDTTLGAIPDQMQSFRPQITAVNQ
ncbi:calcium-binding protein [Neisseriaceae bacterium ESL0693]|nr:calcium-binding protein [Neisseriaceae bacterium ESL0693]